MKLPTMLLALLLPACGDGTAGIPAQPPLDITALVRPSTPNTALAAPAWFSPSPDLVTAPYAMPAEALFAAVTAMAARQPRTFALQAYPDRLQAHFVARSAVFGFPDLITVQALPDGLDRSSLVLWSRSVYGHSDLGVNRKRVAAWLAALGPAAAG